MVLRFGFRFSGRPAPPMAMAHARLPAVAARWKWNAGPVCARTLPRSLYLSRRPDPEPTRSATQRDGRAAMMLGHHRHDRPQGARRRLALPHRVLDARCRAPKHQATALARGAPGQKARCYEWDSRRGTGGASGQRARCYEWDSRRGTGGATGQNSEHLDLSLPRPKIGRRIHL